MAASQEAVESLSRILCCHLRNKNTRLAYYRAVTDFFAWCDRHLYRGVNGCEDPRIDGVRRNGDEISTAVGSILFAEKEKRRGMGVPDLAKL
jgi:hypothetical protein